MSDVIKTIKGIHNEDVCLFRIGTFYHCYNRDACILAYIFHYKIKDDGKNGKECGFPVDSLNKVIAKLESKKINYVVIDKRNQYDEEEVVNFKKENQYQYFYLKANAYINYRIRVENINNFLLKNIEKKDFRKILIRIEDIIYEGRKI